MPVLSKPIYETFTLVNDPLHATVTIRQARFGEMRQRAETVSKMRYMPQGSNMIYEQDFNTEDAKAYDIYLTLAAASNFLDEDGNEVLRFKRDGNVDRLAMTDRDFYRVLDNIEPAIVNEIYGYVLKVNPSFRGAQGEGE